MTKRPKKSPKRSAGDSMMSMISPIMITPTTQAIPIFFAEFTQEMGGFLTKANEDHALFRYATIASNIWKNHFDATRTRELEGQAVQKINARAIFANIARWYNADPENMAKAWERVDMQFFHMKWPTVPLGFGLRQGDPRDSANTVNAAEGSMQS